MSFWLLCVFPLTIWGEPPLHVVGRYATARPPSAPPTTCRHETRAPPITDFLVAT